VAVFIFGHTHAAFLRKIGPAGQVVLNTGTWLKLLHRTPVHFGLLPAVYYPSFCLTYFCIEKEQNQLVITYVAAPKTPAPELTWLQRLVTLGKAAMAPTSGSAPLAAFYATALSFQSGNHFLGRDARSRRVSSTPVGPQTSS
jgi:hypothetical protein